MTDYPGLPAPPPLGESALPAGTFDGTCVLVTGGGTGLGKAIATEFARLGASIVIASRKEEHLERGEGGDRSARRAGRGHHGRHPRRGADRGDVRRRRSRRSIFPTC